MVNHTQMSTTQLCDQLVQHPSRVCLHSFENSLLQNLKECDGALEPPNTWYLVHATAISLITDCRLRSIYADNHVLHVWISNNYYAFIISQDLQGTLCMVKACGHIKAFRFSPLPHACKFCTNILLANWHVPYIIMVKNRCDYHLQVSCCYW